MVDNASTTDAPQPFRPSVQLSVTGVRSSCGNANSLFDNEPDQIQHMPGITGHPLVRVPAVQEDVLHILPVLRCTRGQYDERVLDARAKRAGDARERDDAGAERHHHGLRRGGRWMGTYGGG